MSESSVEEQEERRWALTRDHLIRLFRTYDPDHLDWILGCVIEELVSRVAGAGEDYFPGADRYLRVAREVALAELGGRELARAAQAQRAACERGVGGDRLTASQRPRLCGTVRGS